MTTPSRLGAQIAEATAALARVNASCALIGGLALIPHNVVRATQDVDLLYATRPTARGILADAREVETSFGVLRVISAEGLIAFKLQAVTNDPRRTRDLEDIRALLRNNRGRLDLTEVREYFRLFDREALLDELLEQTG